jgi:RNA polymerase sigma factor (TIGR02999 family)
MTGERMEGHEDRGEITLLLDEWAHGDSNAIHELAPLVYGQLRNLADALLRNERRDHTLQGTALVNEMFQQLMKLRKVTLNDRAHFYTFAARLMRRLLVDHARHLKARRGACLNRAPLDAELAWVAPAGETSLDLSAALEELRMLDEGKARAVELRYFLGCTVEESAAILGVSASSIDRDIRFSLAWLHQRLHPTT